jgi:hypothetical protein
VLLHGQTKHVAVVGGDAIEIADLHADGTDVDRGRGSRRWGLPKGWVRPWCYYMGGRRGGTIVHKPDIAFFCGVRSKVDVTSENTRYRRPSRELLRCLSDRSEWKQGGSSLPLEVRLIQKRDLLKPVYIGFRFSPNVTERR